MLSSFADSYSPRLLPQYMALYTDMYRERKLTIADVKMMDVSSASDAGINLRLQSQFQRLFLTVQRLNCDHFCNPAANRAQHVPDH